MLIWLLIIFSVILNSTQAGGPGVCQKVNFYTVSVVKTHQVMRRFTYRKWNGYTGVEFKPVVEHYNDIEYRTKNVEVCCKGYSLMRGKCIPLCDRVCENSECTAPDTCTCLDGYERFNDFRCVPHCEKCVHGFCSAPNICDCYRGYERDEDNVCQPKCEQPCRNGNCSLPDTCSCLPGYQLVANSTYDCQPVCDPPCEDHIKGSDCVAPNVCKCPNGYESSSDPQKCLPICSSCTNGDCTAPEECECWEGYERSSNESCIPVCDESCQNGYCSAPQECTCDPGYELNDYEKFECSPICDNCENGDCIAPNECTCWDGYEKDWNGYCTPACSQICVNGYCSEPENCTCYEEYEKSSNDPFSCVPVCEGCDYGDCMEPGNCTCWEMYEWNFSTNECIFTTTTKGDQVGELLENTPSDQFNEEYCDPPCINGACVEGQCECYTGYTATENNECVSDCEKSCLNGICNADNECVCLEGHSLVNGSGCVSLCAVECINGYCIEPDFCECWEGYVLDYNQTNTNYCIPLCDHEEDGCINGTCVKPDLCECFEGFELSTDDKFLCTPKSLVSEAFSRHSSLWPLYLCIIAIIIASLALVYYIAQKRFGENGYNVDKKEKSKGIVQYNKKAENIAVI